MNKENSDSTEGSEDKNLDLDLDLDNQEKPDPLETLKSKCGVVYMTPLTHLINDAMNQTTKIAGGGNKGFLRGGKIKVELLDGGSGRTDGRLTRDEGGTLSIVGLQNIDQFVGDKGTDVKIFNFILTEMNSQKVIVNGKLTKSEMEVSMQRMVDLGICNSLRAARRSFTATARRLRDIAVKGAVFFDNKTIDQSQEDALFIGHKERNKMGTLRLNPLPDVKWELLSWSQMVLLNYYYKLSNRAANLFLYILQDCKRWRSKLSRKKPSENYIKIPFESIRDKLGLLTPEETINPGRDIRNVILDAIEEIKAMQVQEHRNKDLELYALHKDLKDLKKCNIKEFLGGGYLRVRMKGALLEYVRQVGGKRGRKSKPPKTIRAEVSDA